ncbi:MAG: hypothetical protein FWD98_09625, partial [Defluviitaleaceae bacterium]|nr:hypothetical protein [Defluviitaleaceae bacterium]
IFVQMQGTDDAANLEGSQGRSDAAVAQKDKQNGKFISLQTLKLLPALCLMLAGCWDRVQLENRGFVSAFGIDAYRAEDPPVQALRIGSAGGKDRFVATVCMPDNTGKQEGGTVRLTSAADSLMPALSLIRLGTSQEPYYGQAKAIVLGDGLLRDPELVATAIDALERNREIPRKVAVLASKADAAEVLTADIDGDQFGMYITNFYANRPAAMGLAFKHDLENVLRDLRDSGGTVIPLVEVRGGVVSLSSAVMLSDYKFAGTLDDSHVRGLMFARGNAKDAHITAEFEGVRVPLRISSQRARLSFKRGGDGPVGVLRISVKGSVEEYRSTPHQDISTPQNVARLNKLFADAIEKEVLAAYDVMREAGVDGLGMMERMRKFHYSLYEEHVKNGMSAGDIPLITLIDVHVTDVGAIR